MPMSTITVLSSSSSSSRSSDGLPFQRNMSDFELEQKRKSHQTPQKVRRRTAPLDYPSETVYRTNVSRLVAAKSRPFTVSGRIPVDPVTLTLFFRSKSGITHSLDFPIDVDYDLPPSLEVLIEACRPQSPSGLEAFSTHESLFYPHNLPITTSLELANHPILEAVRTTLFPSLPTGHYLTARRDKLEIWVKGGGMKAQPRPNDSRVATVFVTLPVRFRGGGLVVRNMERAEEKFFGRGGKTGDMEWTAFLADCEHEIEPIQKGCRMSISYAVFVKSFGPSGAQPDPLITPSDHFLDLVTPILNMSRGRRVAFHLTGDYGVSPAQVLAESLVPDLKGGDSVLYHALKLYKLAPELRWSAGGFVWPVDKVIDFQSDDESMSPAMRSPFSILNGSRNVTSPRRTSLSSVSEAGDPPIEDLRTKVIKSGAVPISETNIFVLSDQALTGPISKVKVPFVQNGELEKLVVNALIVVFVP